MSKFNKSYRIRTDIGKDTSVHVKLDRDYDILEIMSLKIDQINDYKLHTSDYGVIAGRVLANDAFGIPNAKISVFISTDTNYNDVIKNVLYPYNTTSSKNKNNIRYNLLPDEQITNCHTIIGTFPEKQYALDNEDILEVFDKYYKYTTRTNNAGDYMIFGVPVGNQTVHVDIDLSDIGILSQKPYDMVYKGYNIEQFENPNKFKHSTNLENLTQVISQDNVTDVIPFWGDQDEGTIGITRCDIKIQYKFEPTCVFMGSVVSDTASNGISKKCIPSSGMGAMDEITTGSGTIEMIRKTPSGDVEEFQVKGTQLINGDGVWCYQIPMNLDYMMTDEFGNMVPTYDPDKGIPTRTRVRFRISMQDFDSDSINMFRCKMLVPHNPNIYSDNCENELDYNYGTNTKETSYRDLFWNCVYSVKSYIPRIQRGSNWKNEKFTGFKRVNYYNDKNPIPYNNIRIRLPFMYRVLCVMIKSFIKVTGLVNWFLNLIAGIIVKEKVKDNDDGNETDRPTFISLSGNLCGDHLENVCYIPGVKLENLIGKDKGTGRWALGRKTLLGYALLKFYVDVSGNNIDLDLPKIETTAKGRLYIDQEDGNYTDKNSIDYKNKNDDNEFWCEARNSDGSPSDEALTLHGIRFTDNVNYLIQCIEMNLAQEYKVIQFDFYNDWINGLIYIPRWMRNIRKKRTFLGMTITKERIKACNENFSKKNNRNIVQQCGVKFSLNNGENFNSITTDVGCGNNNNCHKHKSVRLEKNIFNNGGIVHSQKTSKDQYVYYFKPYENSEKQNIRLFATDIILLGTLNENDKWGIPKGIDELVSSTYQMPPNLALTDSMLEGNEYVLPAKNITMFFGVNTFRVQSIWYGNENKTHLSSLSGATETGSYTELSGVNWNYTGPLQGRNKSPNKNDGYYEEHDLYKPGGHFLGLTCRNSQTTIKTCVNLNRICEYGVWMSQRQDINEVYSTTPIGFISGDEIKGGKYRRIFSTLNSNNLKSQRDENGFFKYDFIHLTPTNFGGELSQHIKNNNGLYNRLMWNGLYEEEYNVIDDDFTDFNIKSEPWVNNKIIVRTNEFLDKEYYKFRFGLDDRTIKDDNEIKKRFLIYEKTPVGNENGSFPMFNNSFYFYFGLHDGRTALDELKKNYFAVCEKHTLNYSDELNKDKYLTIEALEDELTVQLSVSDCQYSLDAMNWINLSANTPTQPINEGSKLYFKSDLIKSDVYEGVGTFTISKKCNLSGNCNSLLFGDDAEMNYDLKNKNKIFHKLFYDCDNIIDASQLKLPATTLSDGCYDSMFADCISLVAAPELPVITLSDGCYKYMFFGCTSLVSAPSLPATTLTDNCYRSMFYGCTSLVTAPELPADTLADNCYHSMFYGCTSLETAPELPADTLADNCYHSMFYGCTSLETAPELPAIDLYDGCYYRMFMNCTSLKEGPSILPATTLADSCYEDMFAGCTSLTQASELPATTLAQWCYEGMFRGCTSLETAPELPATTLNNGCYDYMFSGCTSLNYIKAMFNHSIYDDGYIYTQEWTHGVASEGTFVKNINANWNVIGENGIPEGWVREYDGEPEYLNIEFLNSDCRISFSQHAAIEYREYGSNSNYWQVLPSNGEAQLVGKYEFRRKLKYDVEGRKFKITGPCNIGGCVMSVLYVGDEFRENYKGDEFRKNYNIIENEYSLKYLFKDCTGIKNVSPGLLPATTLSDECYEGMFQGCTSLETAPELPATTLANSCYRYMFYGCYSLTTAPVLPATTLIDYCYEYMFKGCSALNYIKALFLTEPNDDYTSDWVKDVASQGIFEQNDNATWVVRGTNGVPENWKLMRGGFEIIDFKEDIDIGK